MSGVTCPTCGGPGLAASEFATGKIVSRDCDRCHEGMKQEWTDWRDAKHGTNKEDE
jgi:hypothetical protein